MYAGRKQNNRSMYEYLNVFIHVIFEFFLAAMGTKFLDNLLKDKCVLRIYICGTKFIQKILRCSSIFIDFGRYTKFIETTRAGEVTKRILYFLHICSQKTNNRAIHALEVRAHLPRPLKIRGWMYHSNGCDGC